MEVSAGESADRGGNYLIKICTHITWLHYITLDYIAEIYGFTHFYCVFATFIALLEQNRSGNTRYSNILAINLYICKTDTQFPYTTLHE